MCNGTNGTPNLQDRFVVGAGWSYGVGATGGEAFHQLTIDEMPNHNHGFYMGAYGSSNMSVPNDEGGNGNFNFPKVTTSVGGSQPHENRPPYYALAYIMKL